MNKKKLKSGIKWFLTSVTFTLLAVFAEILSVNIGSNTDISSGVAANVAGIVSVVSVIALCLSVVTIFKVERWYKLASIFLILIALFILSLSFFAYSFSGYGQPM